MVPEIIPMAREHVPGVAALERLCFADPWSEVSIAGELENPLSLLLVALNFGQICGYIGSQTVLDAADVMNLAVAPAARRHGVGRALLGALAKRLRQAGVCSLTLEVRPSNEAARALYAAFGFLEAGRRPRYYVNPREDALILRKELET